MELADLVDGVDAVAPATGQRPEVAVAHGLDGRDGLGELRGVPRQPEDFLERPRLRNELALQFADPFLQRDDRVGILVAAEVAVAVRPAHARVAQVLRIGLSPEDGPVDPVVPLGNSGEHRVHLLHFPVQPVDFFPQVGEFALASDVRRAGEEVFCDPNAHKAHRPHHDQLPQTPHHIVPRVERRFLHLEGPFVEAVLVESFRHGSKCAV